MQVLPSHCIERRIGKDRRVEGVTCRFVSQIRVITSAIDSSHVRKSLVVVFILKEGVMYALSREGV